MASRSSGGGTILASGIRTRERKERKLYSDDWALGDEEIEGHHTFNLEEKLNTLKFDLNFVKDMTDTDFNLSYMQKNGFNWPLLFRNTNKLGIVIPSSNFTINDVRLCVGSRRMLDVMDVNTQKNVEMTMKDWQRYYESQDKDKLLNVISLEFSHTKLESLVEAPTVVRQIDWVEKVWPRHLKEAQTESTNVLEDMMYPKVQKYCLMSVSGCYTDFHIDFGGTSVWYHILKGKKIFWLIPPSERNLQLYEQWVLSGKQSDIFFGDTVEKCARIELEMGNTFFIPTGWIHAVYTPEDSLVFGGNFLHSFGIEKQLRVAHVEDTTHVPQKFRYPFFTEMLWYLLERYVHVLLGRTHLSLPPEEQTKYERAKSMMNNNNKAKEHVHLTQYELHGMKAIVMYLHSLPTSKKYVPELIKDPIALIRDVRTVVEQHRYDSPELAVTNRPVMEWWEREPVKYTVKRSVCDSTVYTKKRRQSGDEPKSSIVKLPPNVSKIRHRRIRCKECEPCTRGDCQQCSYCRDMVKYGGAGTMKQTCKLKKCSQPILPATACCSICQLDGWMRPISGLPVKQPISGGPSKLMECVICFKITHSDCLETKFKGIDCIINEDLPNSWECAECVQLGYNKEYKHNRTPSSRISSAGSDTNLKSPLIMSESEESKLQVKVEMDQEMPCVSKPLMKKATFNGGNSCQESSTPSDPNPLRIPTWNQLQARVSHSLVRSSWVIRPAPQPPIVDSKDDDEECDNEVVDRKHFKKISPLPPTLRKEVMLPVFLKLPKRDLITVMCVCRLWSQWAIDPSLWESVSLKHKKVEITHLHGVVRRQPKSLYLDWSEITHDQFAWVLYRLPQLQNLHCEGLSWGVIRPLISPYCPPLSELNLSFCEGIDDDTLSALLRPPPFNRPGFRDTTSRLRQLDRLKLAGTQIGDIGVSIIARSLPFLTHLDLSGCLRLTNQTPALLAHSASVVSHSLTHLDIRGCHRMTPLILLYLPQLPLLLNLAIDPCDFIPFKALKVWGASHGYSFVQDNVMIREPPESYPLAIEGVSDCETDNVSTETKDLIKPELPKVFEANRVTKVVPKNNKSHGKENVTGNSKKVAPANPNNELNINNSKKEGKKQRNKRDSRTDPKKASEELKVKDQNSSKIFSSKEPSQPKCILTPLEESDQGWIPGKTSSLDVKGEKSNTEKDSKIESDKKGKKLTYSSGEEIPQGQSSEDRPSDSCRRSERSNKGRMYKLNFAKKNFNAGKIMRKNSFGKCGKKFSRKKENEIKKESAKRSSFKKRHLNKSVTSHLKRKSKKNIVTRSKNLKKDGVGKKSVCEEIHNPEQKSMVKEDVDNSNSNLKPFKVSQEQTLKINENEDCLKVRILLKPGVQYASKLRKKSREEESPSPSSSPESKRLTPTSKEEIKIVPKGQGDSAQGTAPSSSGKGKDQKEPSKPSGDCTSASLPKKKERAASSSSTSSSSSCHTLPKKLKVELEPINKINRRRSDSQKHLSSSVSSTNVGKNDSSTSASGSSGINSEKSSSRERPERHHRSPRRLSMCQ